MKDQPASTLSTGIINLFKSKGDEVLNHTIAFVPNFSFQPQEFYDRVEKELAAKNIPGLTMSRIDYAEGGLMSHKRIYFRILRERLAFDTCAAPFGTEFFISHRSVYSPAQLKLWHVLVAIGIFSAMFFALSRPFGVIYAAIAVLTFILAIILTFRNAVSANSPDLDSFLLKIPVFGPMYEVWFRKDTYFRQDTRLVYLELIPRLVQEIIEEITAKNGVKLVNQYERSPVLGELYKRKPKAE